MTALISETMMPAGAESAGLRAGGGADSGEFSGHDGRFAGLLARYHGDPPAQPVSIRLPGGVMLPPGGEALPDGLPFPAGEPVGMFALAPAGSAVLAARIRDALTGSEAGWSGAVAHGQTAAAHPPAVTPVVPPVIPDSLHPAARAPIADGHILLDMFRRGDGALALQAETPLPQRAELSALTTSLAAQLPPPAVAMNGVLRRDADLVSTLSQSDGLRGLIRAAEAAADSELLPAMTTQYSGLPSPAPGQGAERALPGWTLATPLHHAQQWGDEVGQRIRWMVGNQMHAAELRINPPQLGPIEVRVSIQNDQMNITFLSQHALVRDTLEDAIPRLRELMNQQGFASVNVDVSQHPSPDGQDADSRGLRAGDEAVPRNDDAQPERRRALAQSVLTGIIDLYA